MLAVICQVTYNLLRSDLGECGSVVILSLKGTLRSTVPSTLHCNLEYVILTLWSATSFWVFSFTSDAKMPPCRTQPSVCSFNRKLQDLSKTQMIQDLVK